MKKVRLGKWFVWMLCGLLTIAAFFAKDFVLYDFHMLPSDYSYAKSQSEKPIQALTSFWFSYGPDRELLYGHESGIGTEDIGLYGKTEDQVLPVTTADIQPIRDDLIGYFIAVLPEQRIDTNDDGITERVYDFARADFGPHTYELKPREFDSDKMNQVIQPLKWVWTILFLCFVFAGGDFCDICPNKIFSPALGGWWVNLALGGFLTIPLLIGSFYIKRFWCLMCPMGFLLGIFYKFNLFKLKKDCMACTECGACYESCPMRLKNIYTEREKEEVQTIDCLMCGECIDKCPEDHALSMTFCGKAIYQSSRNTFMSRYALESRRKHRKNQEE